MTRTWRDLGINLDEIPPGTRRVMDGEVPEDVTASQWLKGKYKQDPAIVHGIFGKTKGDMWAQGRITDAELLDQKGRPLSLKTIISRAESRDGGFYAGQAGVTPPPGESDGS